MCLLGAMIHAKAFRLQAAVQTRLLPGSNVDLVVFLLHGMALLYHRLRT